jgi:hypothetical protein
MPHLYGGNSLSPLKLLMGAVEVVLRLLVEVKVKVQLEVQLEVEVEVGLILELKEAMAILVSGSYQLHCALEELLLEQAALMMSQFLWQVPRGERRMHALSAPPLPSHTPLPDAPSPYTSDSDSTQAPLGWRGVSRCEGVSASNIIRPRWYKRCQIWGLCTYRSHRVRTPCPNPTWTCSTYTVSALGECRR